MKINIDIDKFSKEDKDQLALFFKNAGTKLYDVLNQKFGKTAADTYKVNITDKDAENLESKTVTMSTFTQTITPSSGKLGLSKVIVTAPVVLSSFAITTQPTKTTYVVGESFDITGAKGKATYSNTATLTNIAATAMTVPTVTFTEAGEKTVTVSYTECGITKTADITVTVTAE